MTNISTLDSYPDVITVNELQNILGIGREQAYILANSNSFPVRRVGKRIIIYKPTFIEWLKS
ncbi:helix-turn-helix domain-containing protein [Peribacillus sp. SI8-4]|uniref:helix-turn-helix domain-containing protein n=1 Tax=Peribacillus sp. SI8-4 TaxID=3048009 RepID=UPI002557371F|nr:helix-turn-helix domain-containing protein [Peribacillus sp. SI8-4]